MTTAFVPWAERWMNRVDLHPDGGNLGRSETEWKKTIVFMVLIKAYFPFQLCEHLFYVFIHPKELSVD